MIQTLIVDAPAHVTGLDDILNDAFAHVAMGPETFTRRGPKTQVLAGAARLVIKPFDPGVN